MIATIRPETMECEVVDFRGQVLICDDEPDICEFLGLAVQKRGFQPVLTHFGCECVRLAFQERPAAILLDVGLKDVCGLDVCGQLTDAPQTRDIPIIILSAAGENDIVRRARRNGARYFVRKPYDPNTVMTIMEQAIVDGGDQN